MQLTVLAFAQAAEQLGFRERLIECGEDETPRAVLARIAPGFDFSRVRVAVDHDYREWDVPLGFAREMAIIPPVSGG